MWNKKSIVFAAGGALRIWVFYSVYGKPSDYNSAHQNTALLRVQSIYRDRPEIRVKWTTDQLGTIYITL